MGDLGDPFGVILGVLELSWRPLGRLGGVLTASLRRLGTSGSAWERLGASDHRWLCLRAGPGPETTRSGGGKVAGLGLTVDSKQRPVDYKNPKILRPDFQTAKVLNADGRQHVDRHQ